MRRAIRFAAPRGPRVRGNRCDSASGSVPATRGRNSPSGTKHNAPARGRRERQHATLNRTQSRRRRVTPPSSHTTPYVRFRIRRFTKPPASDDDAIEGSQAHASQSSVSGAPHSCATPRRSTRGRDHCRPKSRRVRDSNRRRSASLPACAAFSTAAVAAAQRSPPSSIIRCSLGAAFSLSPVTLDAPLALSRRFRRLPPAPVSGFSAILLRTFLRHRGSGSFPLLRVPAFSRVESTYYAFC